MRARALLSRLKSSLIGRTRIGSYATQTSDTTSKKLARARETISRKNEELEKIRRQMVRKGQELARLQATSDGSGIETRAEGLSPRTSSGYSGRRKPGAPGSVP